MDRWTKREKEAEKDRDEETEKKTEDTVEEGGGRRQRAKWESRFPVKG